MVRNKKDAYHPSDSPLKYVDNKSFLLKGDCSSGERNSQLFQEVLSRLKYFKKLGKIWHNVD